MRLRDGLSIIGSVPCRGHTPVHAASRRRSGIAPTFYHHHLVLLKLRSNLQPAYTAAQCPRPVRLLGRALFKPDHHPKGVSAFKTSFPPEAESADTDNFPAYKSSGMGIIRARIAPRSFFLLFQMMLKSHPAMRPTQLLEKLMCGLPDMNEMGRMPTFRRFLLPRAI